MNLLPMINAGTLTPDEAALLAAFRAVRESSRADMVRALEAVADRFPQNRPQLRLVGNDPLYTLETSSK